MNLNQTQVLADLQNIFNDTFLEPVAVTPELSARDVDEWDSLIHISLILAVEKAFSLRFRVGEVEATQNVGELADLIIRRAGER